MPLSTSPRKHLPAIRLATDTAPRSSTHTSRSHARRDRAPRLSRGGDRTQDWVRQVEQSRARGAMHIVDGDDLVSVDEPYTQPSCWSESVSTDVFDSLVDELNPSPSSLPSLPTTASIISANESRRYILQSDSEDEEDRRKNKKESSSRPRYNSLLSPEAPKAARKSRKSKDHARSVPNSPISPLDPAAPIMAPYDLPDEYQPPEPSPPPPPNLKPVVPVLSINDIINRHKQALGAAEKAVNDRARKEMGLSRKESPKKESLGLKELPSPTKGSPIKTLSPKELPSPNNGFPSPKKVTSPNKELPNPMKRLPSPTKEFPHRPHPPVPEKTRLDPIAPSRTGQRSPGPIVPTQSQRMSRVETELDIPPQVPSKSPITTVSPPHPPLPERNNTYPRARAPSAPKAYHGLRTPESKPNAQDPRNASALQRSHPSQERPPVAKRFLPAPTANSSNTSLSAEEFLLGARIGQALLDQLDHDSAPSLPTTPSVPTLQSRRSSVDKPPGSFRRQRTLSRTSSTPSTTPRGPKRLSMPVTPNSTASHTEGEIHDHAKYLRSPHLNRTLSIPRQSPDPPLTVSWAEVGHPKGHPVVFFMGLGCVRYLIAFFDDIARAFNLRIICIDRWGLGKTTQVPQEKRTVYEWAKVVEKVLDDIKVDRFQLIAHSAGAPYALAVVERLGNRVRGTLHLLAPWVSTDIDGGYKWLKWVPKGVIKSATAAEWKLQSYLLGKPPPLTYKPVSHNAAPVSYGSPKPSLEEEALYRESKSAQATPQTTPAKGPGIVRKASQILRPRSSGTPPGKDKHGQLGHIRSLKSLRGHSESRVTTLSSPSINTPSSRSPKSSTPPTIGMDDSDAESDAEHDFGFGEGFDAMSINLKMPAPPSIKFRPSYSSFRTTSTASLPSTTETSWPSAPTSHAFTLVLTQASHAESEPGTTSDIFYVILNSQSKIAGPLVDYTKVNHPTKVWYGQKDDRISEKAMRWLERCMGDVQLVVVEGEGHGLLSSVKVMWDVFESLGGEARQWGRIEE
ncbi:hypothetical protein L198_03769 [Cryptococcus wingfieldii CBS 7118]|uniref:AB hydrolase-1 domain-containing protein n=1 Tax=Cryptococcus wingfieldii CBS 7118 TaxID=1295528 RepID=A0A1E3JCC2_9TREE|nr:hypothetical protein L198_03769 [Cryptococcus wingfieldii CBS 7118]ODN98523.1 hypothetical protein L198_03769 [Cryptococcus wingfieldii CBS 7118]